MLFLTAGGTLAFYTYTTYLQKYLVNTSGFSKPMRNTNYHFSVIYIYVPTAYGRGTIGQIGRKPIMIAFGLLGVLFTYIAI